MPGAEDFRAAVFLSLTRVPDTPAATALVGAVMERVAPLTRAGRRYGRGKAGAAKLRTALAAIVGGVLHRWADDMPRLVFRPTRHEGFTGGPVGFRTFQTAIAAMRTAGLVGTKRGVSYQAKSWAAGDVLTQRLAARYWPTGALLELATAHGVTPATIRDDFRPVPPTKPPKVPTPMVLRTLKRDFRDATGGRTLPVPNSTEAAAVVADVEAHNAFAARCRVSGCLPPRFRRVFLGELGLHGRWYAAGNDGAFQTMPERDRLALEINGEGVVEIDARASALSLLCGLAGDPLDPDADPYAVAGLPRGAVKKWVVSTLGNGAPINRTPSGAASAFKGLRAADVGRAVIARYPVLADPARFVPADMVARLGIPARRLLTHYLAGIEAAALTDAMRELREAGTLALPVHDGLIVPASATAATVDAMRLAYRRHVGAAPGLDVARGTQAT
jgi:hypothetical protein